MTCSHKKCNLQSHGKENRNCFVCFMCNCHQGYDDDGTHGGITEQEAQDIGWVKVLKEEWKWLCPKCGGKEEKLDKIFNSNVKEI